MDGQDVWVLVVWWGCGSGCDGCLVAWATTRDRPYVRLVRGAGDGDATGIRVTATRCVAGVV